MDGANCTQPDIDFFPSGLISVADRRHGAIALHVALVIMLFFDMAALCRHYFIPSILEITKLLHLDHGVAGAGVMATAASFPQLVTSLIGMSTIGNAVGVGSSVGASFFNALFIPAMCGLLVSEPLQVTPWPFLRDVGAFFLACLTLLVVLMNNEVSWLNSIVMICCYIIYIIILILNEPIKRRLTDVYKTKCKGTCCPGGSEEEDTIMSHQGSYAAVAEESDATSKGTESPPEATGPPSEPPGEEYTSLLTPPSSRCARIVWVFLLPTYAILFLFIPDCRRPGIWRKLFGLTLVMSLVFIGCISYLLLWLLTIIGDTFNWPDSVMSMTFLAIGSSVPDLIDSVIVSKQGEGDMAIGNTMGSNVFDLMFCLGLLWLLSSLLPPDVGAPTHTSFTITMTIVLLLACSIIMMVGAWMSGWFITKILSLTLLFMYSVVFVTILAYGIQHTLPPCG